MKHRNNLDTSRPTAELNKLKPVMSYLAPYKLQMAGALIALIITSSSVLLMGRGIGYLLDKGLNNGNIATLNIAIIYIVLITILLATGTYMRFFLITYVGERVVADIRNALYSHITSLSPEFFETTKTGEILSRLTTDTTLLQTVVGSSLSIALRNSLLLIGGLGLLIATSPKLAAIVGIMVPIVVAPILLLAKRLRGLSRQSQDKIADISSQAQESIQGIKTIQAFALEQVENKTFAEFVKAALNAALQRVRFRAFLTALVIMFIFGSIAFVLWIGGHDVISGKMSIGQLTSFLFYSVLVATSTGSISEVIGDLQRAAGAAERISELLSIRSKIADPVSPVVLPNNLQGEVIFDNVYFTYPTKPNQPALKNFSLKIKAGSTVALVGPSGAGKSTIFQLLMRFYDVTNGSIKIDNIDIRTVRQGDLRTNIGLVPQDPMIFSGSAFNNIVMGRQGADIEAVRNAAQAAAATEFIERLPDKYNTLLGERGMRISGGEKQRIALARTLLKNPAILLLDEATSALDTANERLIQQAIEKQSGQRTIIIIAHRLSTVQKADVIVVIEEGQIIETGTHKQLIKNNGLYANLVKMQFEE